MNFQVFPVPELLRKEGTIYHWLIPFHADGSRNELWLFLDTPEASYKWTLSIPEEEGQAISRVCLAYIDKKGTVIDA